MSQNPILPIAGIGVPAPPGGWYGEEKVKKFTSEECLLALIEKIKAEPEIIRNQFNIVTKEQSGEMTTKFWPALLDPANWTRLSTHRPSVDENGDKLYGTDREVREYENEFWADERKHMIGTVTTERGEVISINVVARW